MKRYRLLITGADGFVGRHVVQATMLDRGDLFEVRPTARFSRPDDQFGRFEELDVTDCASVDASIADFAPTHVLHLAGITATSRAVVDARAMWEVNLHGTLNVASALLRLAPECCLVFVGSGLVYGDSAKTTALLTEATLPIPNNIYSATKAASDLALGAMVQDGLKVVRLRPFNHTGAGQTEDFVVPSFSAQIARIEAGLQPPVIRVGNLNAERDFLDVRDVVDAYIAVIRRSDELPPGQILNIASGRPQRVSEILETLAAMSSRPIEIETDHGRLRPSDTPRFVGDPTLARRWLGWQPRRAFADTLSEVLEDWRRRYKQGEGTARG